MQGQIDPTPDADMVDLKSWPLRFEQPELEHAYLLHNAATTLRLVRVVSVLAAIMVLAYDLVFRAFGEPGVNRFLPYRFGYAASLGAVFYFSFATHWPRSGQALMATSVILSACAWAAMSLVAEFDTSRATFFASSILVMMFAGGFGLLRAHYALAGNAGTVVITLAARAMLGLGTTQLLADAALLVTTALISVASAYLLERAQRQSWFKQQTIEQQRDIIVLERARADDLLRNILPDTIATRLKSGERPIADSFPEVTVMFADVVQFTPLAARLGPARLVGLLNDLFSAYDGAAETRGVQKVKTDGDAYMAVCGAPDHVEDHAQRMLRFAEDVLAITRDAGTRHGETLAVRIGLNSGPVVAGVIGRQRIIYDLWGDTVNVASRIEGSGREGVITVSETVYAAVGKPGTARARTVQLKGKGDVRVYDIPAP